MKAISKKKRVILFLLCITMLAVIITGCGEKNKSTSINTDNNLGDTYPLDTNEKLTWTTWTTNHSDYLNYKEQPFFKALMEQTGVDIEFKFDVTGDIFNLMLASGDLPDIIQNDWYKINGGPDRQISDGVIIDLTEPINEWAPNLRAYLDEHQDIDKDIKTDSGKYYAFPFIRGDERLTVYQGLMLRKDLLDSFGLEIPETIDEWESLLIKFKNNGVKVPLSFEGLTCPGFSSAYNVKYDFYLSAGNVKYGPIEDNWKEYLTLMNDWYNKELIDKDYGTITRSILNGRLSSGTVGAAYGLAGSVMGVSLAAGKENNSDFDLIGVQYPVLQKGKKPEFGVCDSLYNTDSSTAVTTQSKNVELAVKVLDYAYSEKGHMLYNFGIEGESYEMIDGHPKYKQEMYNYENGDITASLKRYIMSIDHAPCIQDLRMYQQRLSYQQQQNAIDSWAQTNMRQHNLPHITHTSEEIDFIYQRFNDIKTFVDESTIQFIIGTKSLDEFDNYINTLKTLGIDKIIELKQKAYERYELR